MPNSAEQEWLAFGHRIGICFLLREAVHTCWPPAGGPYAPSVSPLSPPASSEATCFAGEARIGLVRDPGGLRRPPPAQPLRRAAAVPPSEDALAAGPLHVPARGQHIFRHWTFGDEPFWTDTLRLNGVVETAVSPATALAVGLKVDAERLPRGFLARADLTSPATTVELLRRDAVVGVEARITLARRGMAAGLGNDVIAAPRNGSAP